MLRSPPAHGSRCNRNSSQRHQKPKACSGSLRVTQRTEGGQPRLNRTWTKYRRVTAPRQLDSQVIVFGPLPGTRVREDGGFTLVSVSPDEYHVAAVGLPKGYYIKSVRTGDNEILDTGFSVDQESGASITVVLSPGAGTVEGAVLVDSGRPMPGATVVLVPEHPKRRERVQFYRTATTDLQGRFALSDVDPGSYKLFAWEAVEFDAWMDPDFMGPIEDQGQPLTVIEHSRNIYQLKLVQAVSADRGRVGQPRN